jgi:hypothetical protein
MQLSPRLGTTRWHWRLQCGCDDHNLIWTFSFPNMARVPLFLDIAHGAACRYS